MERGKTLFRFSGAFAVLLWVTLVAIASPMAAKGPLTPLEPRVDALAIDTMTQFGKLERPMVIFLHDKHTDAVEKLNKDCTACHQTQPNEAGQEQLIPQYIRTASTDKERLMDLYHQNCIDCHRETETAAGKKGPLECAGCHQPTPQTVSVRQPMGMDKYLHYRHAKALENKCEACHHDYDAETKKLFYKKGDEGTCRYCHGTEAVENRVSMRLASHVACVDCHRTNLAQNKAAGPVQCIGCHDKQTQDDLRQDAIASIPELPRMERNQPDVVFVKTGPVEGNVQTADLRMQAVPFDHKGHEQYNDSCRACHHASLTSCGDCHSLPGNQKGDFVKLEEAMHQVRSDQSCIGCHQTQQADQNCAGCHDLMPPNRKQSDASCKTCHMTGPGNPAAGKLNTETAAKMLTGREATRGTYAIENIPQKVVIQAMSNKYEPVEFPHRKIVLALAQKIEGNHLAGFFHTDPGTLCQGCHHNSPVSTKPPACGSCHGKPFDEKNLNKPGLMGAYHRQCLECHDAMGIAKPASRDCTGCHIEKKVW